MPPLPFSLLPSHLIIFHWVRAEPFNGHNFTTGIEKISLGLNGGGGGGDGGGAGGGGRSPRSVIHWTARETTLNWRFNWIDSLGFDLSSSVAVDQVPIPSTPPRFTPPPLPPPLLLANIHHNTRIDRLINRCYANDDCYRQRCVRRFPRVDRRARKMALALIKFIQINSWRWQSSRNLRPIH